MKIRKLLSLDQERYQPRDYVINVGVLPRLLDFLRNSADPKLQCEAAWALTNVASGSSEQTRAVIDAGALPPLCELLSAEDSDLRENVLFCLGNIAGDSVESRDEVLHGAVAVVAQVVNDSNLFSKKLSLQQTATFTLSNFCGGPTRPGEEISDPPPDLAVVPPLPL